MQLFSTSVLIALTSGEVVEEYSLLQNKVATDDEFVGAVHRATLDMSKVNDATAAEVDDMVQTFSQHLMKTSTALMQVSVAQQEALFRRAFQSAEVSDLVDGYVNLPEVTKRKVANSVLHSEDLAKVFDTMPTEDRTALLMQLAGGHMEKTVAEKTKTPAGAGPIPTAKPEEVGLDPMRLQVLDSYFHDLVQPKQGVQQLAGTTLAVARDGKLVHFKVDGDQILGKPMAEDVIFRFYGMTQPVTAVTLMTLWEQAKFRLDDPVSMYLPVFKDMRVLRTPSSTVDDTVPAESPITVRHLLTHTSGLSHGVEQNAVDRYYREHDITTLAMTAVMSGISLTDFVNRLAKAPLLFQPGTHWHHSFSLDVCGALIESLTGDSFESVMQKQVLDPLGMVDSGFKVPQYKYRRVASSYLPPKDKDEKFLRDAHDPTCLTVVVGASGGGGLCGTTSDYLRFAMMLANHGEFQGVRVLAPRTVRLLTANNVEGGKDLKTLGMWNTGGVSSGGVGAVSHWGGVGQALGGQMIIDPVQSELATGKGMYGWSGAAGTLFHVDFEERMVVVYMQQRADGGPSRSWGHLRTLAQGAIVDTPKEERREI